MGIINNVKVYDLNESIIASGYPMRTELQDYSRDLNDNDLRRINNLIEATKKDNSAHSQFLTGIRVNFDMTFTNKGWVEAERYRFLEFVSSQSTMHRLPKFNVEDSYVEYVDKRMIDIMKELIEDYNKSPSPEKYLKILYSNPCGFKITSRMTTNYRCLRNIYRQRKNHRLPEWREFCKWVETLPFAKELLIN